MSLTTSEVLDLLRTVADEVINPRFRALGSDQVEEKNPGDLVTVADREAEVLITQALQEAYPDAVVLGEEAHAGDATEMDRYLAARHAFTVDPVDGTKNFVHGSPDHAVMVGEVRDGQAVRAWIWQPQHELGYVAERGLGVTCNGRPLRRLRLGPDPQAWRPVTSARRLLGSHLGAVGPLGLTWVSCGIDYPKLVEHACDVLLYTRTRPWDHVPGSLMVTEVGGFVGTPDGHAYQPLSEPAGILAAAGETAYRTVLPYL